MDVFTACFETLRPRASDEQYQQTNQNKPTMQKPLFKTHAFISLGANLNSSIGTPAQTLEKAISLLKAFSPEPLLVSSLWATKPIDCPPGSPDYVNAVVGLLPEKTETPLSLLKRLQSIENNIGRTRSGLINEARVLDLDLLSFKEENSATEELMLPHPRATQRKFVLEPLRELVGNAAFPGQSIFIDDLLGVLDDQSIPGIVTLISQQ